MDFRLSEELQILKKTVRRFVDEELIPVEMESRDGPEIKAEHRERFESITRRIGLWLLDVPEDDGGAGLGMLARVIVWEQIARTIAVPSRGRGLFGPEVRPILWHLNDEQKARYLYPVIRDEKRTCFALTEPEAGSDPSAIVTQALRQGDHYLVNGVKSFVTDADKADFAQVMVVTDPANGARRGSSCLLVDLDTPGVQLKGRYKTMMGDEPCIIAFEDCKVPAANLVGREGQGFELMQKWLEVGRIKHGAHSLGVADRCLELGARYAKQRVTFGKPLAERQAIQWMLADSVTELQAARLLVYQAAWKYDQGEDVRHGTCVVKLYADEMAFQVVNRVLQIHGAAGLTVDLPLATWFTDQRSRRITGGSSEVMRMMIARDLLRQYR